MTDAAHLPNFVYRRSGWRRDRILPLHPERHLFKSFNECFKAIAERSQVARRAIFGTEVKNA